MKRVSLNQHVLFVSVDSPIITRRYDWPIKQSKKKKKRLNHTATRLARYLHNREWVRAKRWLTNGPESFAISTKNPSIDLHSLTCMHLWCKGLHLAKKKSISSQKCPSCRWGYNEGCNKSFLIWQKHKQHSNTCGNESVHSSYTSFPRKK